MPKQTNQPTKQATNQPQPQSSDRRAWRCHRTRRQRSRRSTRQGSKQGSKQASKEASSNTSSYGNTTFPYSLTVTDVGAGRADGEANDLLTTLYSSLYRASKFPRSLWEVDYANGNAPIHWSPYTGKVLPGMLSSDVGLWVVPSALKPAFSCAALDRPLTRPLR